MKGRLQKCKKIKNDRPRQLGPFPRFCHIYVPICAFVFLTILRLVMEDKKLIA